MPQRRVLLVDPGQSSGDLLRAVLARSRLRRHALSTVDGFASAGSEVHEREPDVVFCAGTGVPDALNELVACARRVGARVVVIARQASVDDAMATLRAGADDYLVIPCTAERLDLAITGSGKLSSAAEVPSLHLAQWLHMRLAMQTTGGNVSAAARLLGIHRQSLQRMLRKRQPSR